MFMSTVCARTNQQDSFRLQTSRVIQSFQDRGGGVGVGFEGKNRLNLSWSGSLMEPLANLQNTRSLSEVAEVGHGSAPDVHTGMSAGL